MEYKFELGQTVSFKDGRTSGVGRVIGFEKDDVNQKIFYIIESDSISEDDIHDVDKFIGDYLPHNQKKIRRYFDNELSLPTTEIPQDNGLPSVGSEIYYRKKWRRVAAHIKEEDDLEIRVVIEYSNGWSGDLPNYSKVLAGGLSRDKLHYIIYDCDPKTLPGRPGPDSPLRGGESMVYDSSVTMTFGGDLSSNPVILRKGLVSKRLIIIDNGF